LWNCFESIFVMILMTTGSLPVLSAAGHRGLEEDMLVAESRLKWLVVTLYVTYKVEVMNTHHYATLASDLAHQATTVYQGVARQGPAGVIGSIVPSVQEPPRNELATAV
jgi:hypothetical protein